MVEGGTRWDQPQSVQALPLQNLLLQSQGQEGAPEATSERGQSGLKVGQECTVRLLPNRLVPQMARVCVKAGPGWEKPFFQATEIGPTKQLAKLGYKASEAMNEKEMPACLQTAVRGWMPLNKSVMGTKVSLFGHGTWQRFKNFSAVSRALLWAWGWCQHSRQGDGRTAAHRHFFRIVTNITKTAYFHPSFCFWQWTFQFCRAWVTDAGSGCLLKPTLSHWVCKQLFILYSGCAPTCLHSLLTGVGADGAPLFSISGPRVSAGYCEEPQLCHTLQVSAGCDYLCGVSVGNGSPMYLLGLVHDLNGMCPSWAALLLCELWLWLGRVPWCTDWPWGTSAAAAQALHLWSTASCNRQCICHNELSAFSCKKYLCTSPSPFLLLFKSENAQSLVLPLLPRSVSLRPIGATVRQ